MNRLKRSLQSSIRRTYADPDFWDVMVNNSKVNAGPFDGGCLVCAKALIEAFKSDAEVELVRMTSELNGGQTEHYGARIGGYICDFYGAFDTPNSWIKNFIQEEQIHDRKFLFETGFVDEESIIDDPQTSKKVALILMENKPDEALILNAQAREFNKALMKDPSIIFLRAQGLEIDLTPSNDGLEISSLFVPEKLRGQGLAARFIKKITELADKQSMCLVLEVGRDEAEIGLSDWYERHGFRWADGYMERTPMKSNSKPISP